jgi:hypothetical protein
MNATRLLFLLLATIVLPTSGVFAQGPGGRPDPIETFQDAMERSGFVVNAGMADTMDWAEEYCAGVLPSGGYVNKAPYVRLRVPKSSEDLGLTEVFKLRPDEAVVLIGETLPPVNYFGYHACLWSRAYPGSQRQRRFATLGDTVNNATINTTGPDPFSRPAVFIFTPDQGTDARVRAALHRAGYPTAMMNTIVFPAAMLNLGHGELDDELRIVMRVGKWQFPEVGQAYMDNLSEKMSVFRVTPSEEAAADPFPVPPLRVRGTGQTEMDLMDTLARLRQGIIDAHAGLYQAVDIPSRPNWYEGYDYIQRDQDPGGDSRDAFFLSAGYLPEYGSLDEFTLADGEFLVVYGPNHVATGKATYMSVNAYASETAKLSIGQVFDTSLAGTAGDYLPAGDPDAGLLYAYRIARDCAGHSNCLELSADDYNTADHPTCVTVNAETVLGVIFRMYLEPATNVGPAMPEMLYDRVIKFSPRY